jgi:ADP-ribose pyrophosphatase YjhB (NUDIX family)
MKQTAGIIVLCEDRILLCKRSDSGQWAIPMGHMEDGEEPIDCAYREFYEETYLEITDPIKSIGRIKKKKNGKVKSILHIFLFEVDSEVEPNLEDAQDGHEHTECGYFDIEEIEDLDMEESLKKFIFKIFY